MVSCRTWAPSSGHSYPWADAACKQEPLYPNHSHHVRGFDSQDGRRLRGSTPQPHWVGKVRGPLATHCCPPHSLAVRDCNSPGRCCNQCTEELRFPRPTSIPMVPFSHPLHPPPFIVQRSRMHEVLSHFKAIQNSVEEALFRNALVLVYHFSPSLVKDFGNQKPYSSPQIHTNPDT